MTEQNTMTKLAGEVKSKPLEDTAPRRVYRILFLEDNPDDIELMQFELDEAKLSHISESTDKKSDFMELVYSFKPDVVLADYSLSSFNGVQAFTMLKKEGLIIPFILVTGALSEMLALECLKVGIDDFVLKASFKRLPNAIISVVEKREAQEAKDRMAKELKKSHEELRLLLHRYNVSLEEERKTIARDLHDELGQVLTALKMNISVLSKKILSSKPNNEAYVINEFKSITDMVDQITKSVKEISAGLRPETLDALGIIESIRWQVTEFEKRNNIRCKTLLPNQHLDISKDLSITIFRIVQESLTNIIRHAGATEVEVRLTVVNSHVLLETKDNGKGISEQQIHSSNSLGLIGLRERVYAMDGVSTITGDPLNGTLITVMLPIKPKKK
jgi:signal transduction histidine kinase